MNHKSTIMKYYKVILVLTIISLVLSCKKDKTNDPLVGLWKIDRVYTKQISDLQTSESTTIVADFYAENNYYPTPYTHLDLREEGDAYLTLGEPVPMMDNTYLYTDPEENNTNPAMVWELQGKYNIQRHKINIKIEYSDTNTQLIEWPYELVNGELVLTVLKSGIPNRYEYMEKWYLKKL